jgi:hypothetical protein
MATEEFAFKLMYGVRFGVKPNPKPTKKSAWIYKCFGDGCRNPAIKHIRNVKPHVEQYHSRSAGYVPYSKGDIPAEAPVDAVPGVMPPPEKAPDDQANIAGPSEANYAEPHAVLPQPQAATADTAPAPVSARGEGENEAEAYDEDMQVLARFMQHPLPRQETRAAGTSRSDINKQITTLRMTSPAPLHSACNRVVASHSASSTLVVH